MKLRSKTSLTTLLTLAALGSQFAAQAILLPVAEDTSSNTKGDLNQTAGKATTLSVTSKEQAFLAFDLPVLPGGAVASNIVSARLNVYVSSVTTAGELTVYRVTNAWEEYPTTTVPAPGISSAVVATIPETNLVAKSFVEVDVTSAVSNWYSGEGNFGLAITTSSANLRLASKEGTGVGFPAVLEITVASPNSSSLDVTGSVTATSFTGNGGGLTNLNATNLTGTVPAIDLGNAALLNANQTFTGQNSFATNVAIGTNASAVTLAIATTSAATTSNATAKLSLYAFGGHAWLAQSISGFDTNITTGYGVPAGSLQLIDVTTHVTNMTFAQNGTVGIGTATPLAGLDVETTLPLFNSGWSYFQEGRIVTNILSGTPNIAIYTAGAVGANVYYAFSDARIKNIIGVTDPGKDLKTLRAIEVTDYTYKDTVAHGKGQVKKVIAQQVESVYPQAVTRTTGVVPDVYQETTVNDGWVKLATDLKVGERVKLVGQSGQGIYEVLETRNGAFRTDFKPATEKVFVYGREVKDFRNVDYDALTTLNVSATQELARKVDEQKSELTELRSELARLRSEKKSLASAVIELKARDQEREDRLTRVENALKENAVHLQHASLELH